MVDNSDFRRRSGDLTISLLLATFVGYSIGVMEAGPWLRSGLLILVTVAAVLALPALTGVSPSRSLPTRGAIVASLPTLLITGGVWLSGKFEKVGDTLIVIGVAMLLWSVGIFLLRWRALPEAAAPEVPSVASLPEEPGRMMRWWEPLILVLSAVILILALLNLAKSIGSINAAFEWLLRGTGLYWFLVVVSSVGALLGGQAMRKAGSVTPAQDARNAARDRLWMLRFGGRSLSAFGLGFMLVAFWYSQRFAAPTLPSERSVSPTPNVSESIGFFDLMTWLGTFATFVIVVATALVAMYVKRRDDESQHSAAVTDMRQRWINKLRENLAVIMAAGHRSRAAADRGEPDPNLAGDARLVLREVQLRLNPTEGHHAVLLLALRSWLHHAGIEDHFRAKQMPPPLATAAEFDTMAEWLVKLGQLVLKVEWVVTSLSRASVEAKARGLWDELRRFEEIYKPELERLAPEAITYRHDAARGLLEGATESAAPNT